ncbi:MAG: diacylglycerol/lipid kinase family protein [Chthoniobacterales bacterium]
MWGLLIYNASSGPTAKHTPGELQAALREGGAEVRLHEFTDGDEPAKITADAVAAGARWIAVAGGDGTVEAAATALLGTGIPLGIIPCGTYNNFALSAAIPADPLEACRTIAAGGTRDMDVGFVNGQPFFECVGTGLDAALFPLGEEIKSGAISKTWELFRRAAAYPMHRFEIELDRPLCEALVPAEAASRSERRLERVFLRLRKRRLRVRALMITISNGPYYGMNFTVAPGARIDDGRLTVTIFKRLGKLRLWWHYFSIRAGRSVPAPRLIALRASRIRISHKRRLPVHADGSPAKIWPLDISIRGAALRIFSPAGQT